MNDWKECKLGDIAEIQTGPFGSQLHASDYIQNGIPSIMPTNIGNRLEINMNGIACVKESDAKRLERYLVKDGDVVYSRRGDVEKCAYINTHQAGFLCGTGCLRIRFGAEAVSPKFCAYFLSTDEIKGWIVGHAVGTTMPNLNSSILKNVPVQLPPLPEQRAIASVLSSLDEKIDLLHRQNKTLEGMAGAVYRHFFVEGKKSNWKECVVNDLAIHDKCSIHPNRDPEVLFSHYSIPAFDQLHTPISELGSSIQSNKYKVPKNTILFSKLNPHRDKRVWLIPDSISDDAVCSTEFQVMNPKSEKYLLFLYGFITLPENYDEIASGVGGTSGSHQRIDPEVIFNFKCFIPNDDFITDYNELAKPIFRKAHHNLKAIQTLGHQRDLLLPKLMSGEVRVAL